MRPLIISGLPTGGKGVLAALLDGGDDIFTIPMWHDYLAEDLLRCITEKPNYFLAKLDIPYKYCIFDYLISIAPKIKYILYAAHAGEMYFPLDASRTISVQFNASYHIMFDSLCAMLEKLNFEKEDLTNDLYYIVYKSILNSMIKNNSKMLCTSVIDTRCYKFSNIYKSLNNAKFIYISRNIRDSFAVVISREAHILGKSVEERIRFVVNTWGLEVVKAMLAAKHFAASNKELMHLVDFDEMILDTEKCMRNICKWLNIKFDDFMLQATFNGRVISREAVKKVIDSAEKVMSRDNLYLLDKMLDYLLVKANFELFESC